MTVRARLRVAVLSFLSVMLPSTAARSDVVHIVKSGETLANIALKYYGDAGREITLVTANVLNAQSGVAIVPGMHLTIPSVGFHRVKQGESWNTIATVELGSPNRARAMAQANNADVMSPPSPGTILRVPYLLRYVVTDDTPLFEIARQFYNDRSLVQYILEFNGLQNGKLQRGQMLLLPIADVVLKSEPVCEGTAALAQENASQRSADKEIPALVSFVGRGQYLEAVKLGSRLSGEPSLSAKQKSDVHRALAEAYCALDRKDLAAESFKVVLETTPDFVLDPDNDPPKLVEALHIARGLAGEHTIAPAPPSSRPDDAH